MLGELVPGVTVRTSPVELVPRMSLLRMMRLTWSMARAVPPSDVVISTHTPTTAVGLLAGRLWRRGRLVWLYQDYAEMFVGRPYEAWLLHHALAWHECALTVSEYCRQELITYTPGQVIVVGEGLSHPELLRPAPDRKRHGRASHRTILFVGDARPRKGLADFMQAADQVYQRVHNIKLQIVSKQDLEIDCRVPFEYVHRPTRAELMDLIAACDLFVSASWREGFGLPPLEAMACGAPVVLTDSGGVREYARHEENCLMVPTRDPDALAEAMVRLLTDAALAGRVRRNGPRTAAQFTWDRAVDRFERALNDLLGEHRTPGTGA
jgi:glycosyltransferase involved in cell wall biosynthesis